MRTRFKVRKSDPRVRKIIAAAFPDWRGRKVSVEIADRPLDVRSCWDGGSRDQFVFVRLDTLETLPMPAQSAFDPKIAGAEAVTLPEGCVCVEHSHFQGRDVGVTIHVPVRFQDLLPQPKGAELS